jgi:eukaryotic-like serine/threonine-protein kinase
LAVLGEGGMGQVFLAAGPDGRLVALKLVHPALAADAEFRARYRRKMAASRAVSGACTDVVGPLEMPQPTKQSVLVV